MIRDVVSHNREPLIQLRMQGPAGSLNLSTLLDTGFNGTLSIPVWIAQQLGLARESVTNARLADGSVISYGIFRAKVEAGGAFETVLVSAMGDECLLGMAFLDGYELRIKS